MMPIGVIASVFLLVIATVLAVFGIAMDSQKRTDYFSLRSVCREKTLHNNLHWYSL